MTDRELLQQYVDARDERAFAELVRRHVDWVNSMAQRMVRDPALAADVTQAVFILLEKKASRLRRHTTLSGWLFLVTRHAAHKVIRSESRRRKHEGRAAAMKPESTEHAAWDELAPMLDDLVSRLRLSERQALLMRFYEQKTYPQIGQAFQISEDAARKRVDRAVDQLRELFGSRGVTVGSTALAGCMLTNLIHPASAAVVAAATAPQALAGTSLFAFLLKPIALIVGFSTILTAASVVLLQQNAPAQNAATAPSTAPAQMRFGKVLSPDDQPVAGAKVFQTQWSQRTDSNEVIASATTDSAGRFQFPDASPYWEVLVQSDSLAFGGGMVRSRWEDDPSEIRLMPPTTMRLRFIAPDGKAAAGVRVVLAVCGESRNGWRSTIPTQLRSSLVETTDVGGVCSFSYLPQGGIAWVEVLDERYAQLAFAELFELYDTATSDTEPVRLKPAAVISGKVTFADTAKPGAGIQVIASAPDSHVETVTDEQGRYAFKQLRDGNYCVFLFLSDELSRQVAAVARENLRVVPGARLENQDLTLIAGGIVRGKMTSRETGKPIAGLEVFVDGPSRPQSTHTIQIAKSGEDGEYLIHVPPGKQRVQFALPPPKGFKAPSPMDRDVVVVDGQAVEVDFKVPAAPVLNIKGRTLDPQGNPLAGVEIYVERKEVSNSPGNVEAISEADGSFSLPMVESTSLLRARKGKWSTAQPLKPSDNLTITLQPNALATIRVSVKQKDGSPVANAKLQLTTDNGYIGRKPAAADGTGIFKSLAPDLQYIITASAKGFTKSEVKVKVKPGEQIDAGSIVLTKADSFISGMVMDQNGEPAPDIIVEADTSKNNPPQARTDAAGQFRIEEIVPGDNVLIMANDEADRFIARADNVKAGTSGLILTLKPARQQ